MSGATAIPPVPLQLDSIARPASTSIGPPAGAIAPPSAAEIASAAAASGVGTSPQTDSLAGSGAAPAVNPSLHIDPALSIVVLQFFNAHGVVTQSIPSQKQIDDGRGKVDIELNDQRARDRGDGERREIAEWGDAGDVVFDGKLVERDQPDREIGA